MALCSYIDIVKEDKFKEGNIVYYIEKLNNGTLEGNIEGALEVEVLKNYSDKNSISHKLKVRKVLDVALKENYKIGDDFVVWKKRNGEASWRLVHT